MDGLPSQSTLSAPNSLDAERKLCTAVLAVATLSVLGGGWILLSVMVVPSLRTFRHQLILGLGLSDFLMALNVMLSTSMNLSGRHIWAEEQRAFCSFNGFMNQMFVIQTDYWILIIAVCTYLILMDHTATASWIQEYRIVLWCLPWILSILWATLGLVLVGYGNIGAWCWFTSDRIRLLVNFTPRWAIIVIILALYTRLCIFLYRSHKSISSDYETSASALPTELQQWQILDGQAGIPGGCEAHSVYPSVTPLKNISRRMMIYPTVYALIWVIPTAVRIYHGTTGRQAPVALSIIDNACIISHGLADAIIYGANERVRNGWLEKMHCRWRWPWRKDVQVV
ncbi:G protein-coupled glucose receptor regulating Gpa2-domain-containing protein [Aspergillus keveii]|uniref:G protein-coupled glucose receptor regulating Gpa2-domain-containing protein n=1 Tax=Aspergillus keveii TaxID=714993 RepID=A0ABR4G9V0_9EURO